MTRPYYSTFPAFTFINEIQSIGNSNYNSLQSTLRVSDLHGFSGQAAYTWSHSFDEVTAYRGALPQDSTDFKGDYGSSDFDARHIFVGLVSYNVPGTDKDDPGEREHGTGQDGNRRGEVAKLGEQHPEHQGERQHQNTGQIGKGALLLLVGTPVFNPHRGWKLKVKACRSEPM